MPRPRVGFTTRASCLLAAGVTAVVCGVLLGATDLLRAGVFAFALPWAAAFVVYRSRVRIAAQRSCHPPRAAAGDSVTQRLVITNGSLLPTGAVLLEDQLPTQLSGHARFVLPGLASREARTVAYRMPALPRGRYRSGPLRIRLTDPFRLIDVVRSFTATSDFVVTPVVEPLPALQPPRSYDIGDNAGSHSVGVHGADDASTREYRTGDDLRKIHWRSSARVGALMVRQEERPWQGQTTVLLDLRACAHASGDPQDRIGDTRERSSLEWAVSAAASIGTHLMLAGREVGLLTDTATERFVFEDPGRLGEHLAGVAASARGDLTQVASLVRAAAQDSALVAVLGTLDAVSLRVLSDAHPRGAAIPAYALVLDTLTWSGGGAGQDPELRRAARMLGGAGWHVAMVVHGDRAPAAWQALLHARVGAPRWAALR